MNIFKSIKLAKEKEQEKRRMETKATAIKGYLEEIHKKADELKWIRPDQTEALYLFEVYLKAHLFDNPTGSVHIRIITSNPVLPAFDVLRDLGWQVIDCNYFYELRM